MHNLRHSPRIPRRALFGDQVIGYDSEEQETDSDHPSVPSLLTVSETEDEADSADDGATDNATDNESDTDSDYDSLPSLLTESETDGLLQRESVHSHAVLWLP